MEEKKERKPNGYWTYERCSEICKSCKNWAELESQYKSVYHRIKKNGWVEQLCSHMEPPRKAKPNGYWTDQLLLEESLKFSTPAEFEKKSKTAYYKIVKSGKQKEMFAHMTKTGNRYKRMVYLYIFVEDNSAYIGLTHDETYRQFRHKNSSDSAVFQHIKKTGYNPEYTRLSDYVSAEEAKELEIHYVNVYREKGYNILNKAKPGNLGGSFIRWNFDNVKKLVDTGISYIEFKTKNVGAYASAKKNNWLDELFLDDCDYIKSKNQIIIKWDFDSAFEESKKYTNKSEFQKKSTTAYTLSYKNGWLNTFYPVKLYINPPTPKWNYENVLQASKSCTTRSEFSLKFSKAAKLAREMGWMDHFYPIINDDLFLYNEIIRLKSENLSMTAISKILNMSNNKFRRIMKTMELSNKDVPIHNQM